MCWGRFSAGAGVPEEGFGAAVFRTALPRGFLATATGPLSAERAFLTVFLTFLAVFFTAVFAPAGLEEPAFFVVTFFAI